jgi:L-alanine-DL-glutamate epimerase-like enolase superfamily enzyme
MAITLDYRFFEMSLRHPFTISRYTVNVQKTVIVRISDGEFSGYGEATVNPYYHSTVERLSASLSKVKQLVDAVEALHPAEFWNLIMPHLHDDYFALCAVDIAYWDLYARKHHKTLRSYFMGGENTPLTSYTIGIDTLETMRRKIIEMPWPVYKIKLGTPDDLAIVENLRKITDAVFRIDANCAWNADQTIRYSKILKDMDVEFIEQPLPAEDVEGMRKVKAESALPVIADESCQRPEDIVKCAPVFHGVNIKLMKCGGITPALKMISEAREKNLLIMAGCMTESTIGISALVQLAPLLDYLDADGALLLREDVARGVSFDSGKISYAEGFGSGAEIYAF